MQYQTTKANLHHFWDEDIIDQANINLESFLNLYKSLPEGKADTIEGIHPALWMKESIRLLEGVYDFPEFTVDNAYLDQNAYSKKTIIGSRDKACSHIK